LSPGHGERGSSSLYRGLGQSPQWGSKGHLKLWRRTKFDTSDRLVFAVYIREIVEIIRWCWGGAKFAAFGV